MPHLQQLPIPLLRAARRNSWQTCTQIPRPCPPPHLWGIAARFGKHFHRNFFALLSGNLVGGVCTPSRYRDPLQRRKGRSSSQPPAPANGKASTTDTTDSPGPRFASPGRVGVEKYLEFERPRLGDGSGLAVGGKLGSEDGDGPTDLGVLVFAYGYVCVCAFLV